MVDLLQIVRNIVSFLDEFQFLFGVICFVLGVIFAIKGLMGAARRQEMGPGHGGWGGPMMMFTTGALFAAFPSLVNSLSMTFFMLNAPSSAENIFSYAPATVGIMDGAEARTIIVGITSIVQFIGLIAIARGLYMMNLSAQSAQGPKTFGPGLTFLIAGAMATNFPSFVGVVEMLLTATGATSGPLSGIQ